jgi:hypothetical protein
MLGKALRRYARQQRASDAQVNFGAVLFRDQCISCLLDPVVQELAGAVLAKDEPGMLDSILRLPIRASSSGNFQEVWVTKHVWKHIFFSAVFASFSL